MINLPKLNNFICLNAAKWCKNILYKDNKLLCIAIVLTINLPQDFWV